MHKQLVSLFTTLILFVPAARGAAPTTDPIGDSAIAERFAQIAKSNLATRSIGDITLREAAALLQGACKLDPTDPRYPHLLAEACLALRDTDGAIKALTQCTTLDGSDQGAQVQLVDLYAAGMQSADAQVDYLKKTLSNEQIAPEVRAHIGVRLAKALMDRGQDAQATEALGNALKLNPLDPDACEMKEKQTRNGPVRDHIAALLALLRCNPAQPAIQARLAEELAGEGLTNEAATWYSNAIGVGGRLGMRTDPATFCSYVEELLIGNQTKGVDTAIDSLLKSDPTNVQGLYLKMLLTRRGDDKDATAKAVDDARDGFLERLYAAYRTAAKNDPPTTRPSGELLERAGDVVAQAKQVKQSGNEAAISQYAAALTDLAWLEIYFAQTPAPGAQLTAALHDLLPDDDVRFERLDGWALLAAGKPDEAKVKLSAVAERDPLSAMGLVRIAAKDAGKKDDAKSSAQALLDDNRSGVLAAMLLDGLRDLGVSVQVSTAGNDIKADLEKFPKTWFTFLDTPENFYSISCQATKVSYAFDEPILGVVTVINTGPFDIAVGPNCALKPDLWFDVSVRGPQAPQNLSGVAYDRLVKRLVLKHGESFQQLVRLDQPKLSAALQQNPIAAITLLFNLLTNPNTGAAGIVPGPGGQRVLLRKPVERAPNPLNAQRQQMLQNNLVNARTDVRMTTMSLVAAYAQMFAKSTDEKIQAQSKQLAETVSQLANDPSQPVGTWSRMLQISMESPENRAATLKEMAASDYWPQRMLAVAEALGTGPAGKDILTALAKDSEPIVKKFAEAALDDLAHPTTQPTTGPSSAPSSGAPAMSAPTTAPSLDLRL